MKTTGWEKRPQSCMGRISYDCPDRQDQSQLPGRWSFYAFAARFFVPYLQEILENLNFQALLLVV